MVVPGRKCSPLHQICTRCFEPNQIGRQRKLEAITHVSELDALWRSPIADRVKAMELCVFFNETEEGFVDITKAKVGLTAFGFANHFGEIPHWCSSWERQRGTRIVRRRLPVWKGCVLDKKLVDPVGVNTSKQIAKLSANAFARKLLTSSPTARPLHLRYYSMELNSVLNWLECWSTSRFWKPTPQRKKVPGPKSPRKQANSLNVDSEPSRLKQSIRKIPAVSVDGVSMHSTTEFEKPKCYARKISTHSIDIVPENPEHELEKVKRSLRKVHNPIVERTVQSEIESEKSRSSLRKVSSPSGQNGLDHSTSDNAEKMETETAMTRTKLLDVEKVPEPVAVKKAIHLLQDAQTAVDLQPLENMGEDDKISGKNGESGLKDKLTSNDNQKSGRKASFPAKQEHIDNESQNRPAVPSYMAATQSAKARLRGQGSPGLGQDGPEKHNLTRRHSLPSSTISKTTSQSPRAHRPVQSSGKGGNRSDRSLLSSRDGNMKVNKAEWRR